MSLMRINRVLNPKNILKPRCFSTVAPLEDDEYTNTPQYPPILDLSFKKKIERQKETVHEQIKALQTVEEKQIKLNMPR